MYFFAPHQFFGRIPKRTPMGRRGSDATADAAHSVAKKAGDAAEGAVAVSGGVGNAPGPTIFAFLPVLSCFLLASSLIPTY